jgi:hypothetical protein
MREAKMVHGRVTAGDYKPEVHDACNKIAAELHARAQPKPPTEQEMENAAKAAISAAGQK